MQSERISQTIATGGRRPVYMVLRHLGVEPPAAINALCAAGFRPAQHGVLCSELTREQADRLADYFV